MLIKGSDPSNGNVVEDEVVGGGNVGGFPVGHVVEVDMRTEASCELSLAGSCGTVDDERFRSDGTRVLSDLGLVRIPARFRTLLGQGYT